jgi:hypothetical protein
MKQRRTYIAPKVEQITIEEQNLLASTNFSEGQTGSQNVYNDEGYSPENGL